MFQRKNASSLPTTSPLSLPTGDSGGAGVGLGAGGYSGSNMGYGMSNRGPDGSGKAIKMDAPVVKAWKKTSSWTKYSYIIMSICVTMMFIGYRYLRMGNGAYINIHKTHSLTHTHKYWHVQYGAVLFFDCSYHPHICVHSFFSSSNLISFSCLFSFCLAHVPCRGMYFGNDTSCWAHKNRHLSPNSTALGASHQDGCQWKLLVLGYIQV